MTTWVLLRGLTREARHWGGFPDRLARAIPGSRILAPDLPGCGTLSASRSPASIEANVAFLRQSLRAAGTTFPVHVLGLSLGAMVAVDWALRHPAELGGCVLVNTSLGAFSAFHERLRPGSYPRLARIALPGLSDRAREAAVLSLTSNVERRASAVVEQWAAFRRESPVTRGNALRQLVAAARYRRGREAPAVATLVLASEGDRLVDPECSRKLAARWGVPLAVHPSAGHDLPLDDGEWVVARVREWSCAD